MHALDITQEPECMYVAADSSAGAAPSGNNKAGSCQGTAGAGGCCAAGGDAGKCIADGSSCAA